MYKYGLGVYTACFPCNKAESWQQLISPPSGHKKLNKLDIILTICNLKKEIGLKSEKICIQVRDQIL